MKKQLLLLAFLIAFATNSLTAQVSTKVNLAYLDKVPLWLAENNVPVAGIGIIENGKLKYVKVFGELQKNVPAPTNTIFSIA